MKKLLFLLLFLPLLAFTQVPQAVGYQGVATDANGVELVNQSISIRASVLSGSATGTIEWQETHNTSTDTFGLFNLTIGQGTSTGNGAQTSFADITWGVNTHFLKIEMDVNGGTNYSHMGTNQMMSVPYALYAENANINYDSIATILSNDSLFKTTLGYGIGGGCNFKYPDGLDGEPLIWDFHDGPYIVPAGKNLYINSYMGSYSGHDLMIDSIKVFTGPGNYIRMGTHEAAFCELPIIATENQILTTNSTGNQNLITGLLVNKDAEPITQILSGSAMSNIDFTVPSGKIFVLFNIRILGGWMKVDGDVLFQGYYNYFHPNNSSCSPSPCNSSTIKQPILFKEGQTLSIGLYQDDFTINGYLVDENYFSDCGGGSSGSNNSNGSNINSIIYTIDGF